MKKRWKVLWGVLGAGGVALAGLMVALSHEGACPAPVAVSAGETMQAIVQPCYGAPEVLRLQTVAKPVASGDRVLVRVRVAAVNPLDWHYLRGKPYVMRLSSGLSLPDDARFGADFAGVVEAVGEQVTRFKPGDEVFGAATGAFAQYVVVREARIAIKPASVSFDQAAAIPIAGVTALQAMRNEGALVAGRHVLINGASGGVGTMAVQIAKAMGATVTGVCSTRNVDLVRGLGADQVVDYTAQDFTQGAERYDLVLDLVGNHGVLAMRRVVEESGAIVRVGSFEEEPFLGPVWGLLAATIIDPFVSQRVTGMLADITTPDLEYLAGLAADGRLRVAIDRRWPLAETAEAVRYVESGRTRGKVVIDLP